MKKAHLLTQSRASHFKRKKNQLYGPSYILHHKEEIVLFHWRKVIAKIKIILYPFKDTTKPSIKFSGKSERFCWLSNLRLKISFVPDCHIHNLHRKVSRIQNDRSWKKDGKWKKTAKQTKKTKENNNNKTKTKTNKQK